MRLVPILAAACVALPAFAQETAPLPPLPAEISMTNAILSRQMREAIAAGDPAKVIELGGRPQEALAAALNQPNPGQFQGLVDRAAASPQGRLVFVTYDDRTGLALMEEGRIMYAHIPSKVLLGPAPRGAVPITDISEFRVGRTLLTLNGRRLADDPSPGTAPAPQPPPATGQYGVQSINLRTVTLIRDE